MVLYLELQTLWREPQTYPRFLRSGMARHVVQSLLQNTINMNCRAAMYGKRCSRFLVGYANSRLPFHHRQIPLDSRLEPSFVQHHRMQSLRQAANFVERGLRNLSHLEQVAPQLRSLGQLISGPSEHHSHCRQNLSEVIVEFARNVT